MRLATWNVERLRSGRRRARALDWVNRIAADIWVFTEADSDFAPHGLRHVHTSLPDPARHPRERWVSIVSSFPLEPVALVGDPIRSAAAFVHPPGTGALIVFGTVLPWTTDRWRGHRGSDAFAAALAAQLIDLRSLRTRERSSKFVLAGDFNQHLGDGDRYWSGRNKRLISEALAELGLTVLTANPTDPVQRVAPDRRSVDHVCVAKPLECNRESLGVWPPGPQPDPLVSDHFGVVLESAPILA